VKALVTFGTGSHGELLDVSLPTFRAFAERHGYDVLVAVPAADDRPPAWGKIRVLQRVLGEYDVVLWIDADAIVLDASVDPDQITPADAFQALVRTRSHPEHGTDSPCTGVWLLRAGERTSAFLASVWDQEQYIDHHMWEQAAVMHLLGWTTELPVWRPHTTEWEVGTHWLDERWDMLPDLPIGYSRGFIRHYAGMPHSRRLRLMRTDRAHGVRRLVGEFERRALVPWHRNGRRLAVRLTAPARSRLRRRWSAG
jgi:hypothetical protein